MTKTTDKSKEWLFADDLSDDMSRSDIELTNYKLGLKLNVEDITHLVSEIFVFRQVLNGRPKKSVNKKGIELAPILLWLLRTNPGKIKTPDWKKLKYF